MSRLFLLLVVFTPYAVIAGLLYTWRVDVGSERLAIIIGGGVFITAMVDGLAFSSEKKRLRTKRRAAKLAKCPHCARDMADHHPSCHWFPL